MTEKACTKCGEVKPLDDFYKRAAAADGRTAMCKACSLAKSREWREANRDKVQESWRKASKRYAHTRRLRRYGLSQSEYDTLLLRSGGLCEVCGAAQATCVDHNHETGAVRGLLCGSCNAGLGLLGDTPARLEMALKYLSMR